MSPVTASPARRLSRTITIEDRCAITLVERIIRDLEPYLELAAEHIAAHYPAAVPDLVQEARITLWELDLGRYGRNDSALIQRIVYARMVEVYHAEVGGGLTGDATSTTWLPLAYAETDGSCLTSQLTAA